MASPPMPKLSPLHREVLAAHRERLAGLIDRSYPTRLKKLYDKAQDEVAAKLARAVRGGRRNSFTAQQHRIVLSQIRQGQAQVAHRMTGALGDASAQVQHAALRGLISDVRKLEAHFRGLPAGPLPIEEAATFSGVIKGRAASLLDQHATSMGRYGARVVRSMREQMSIGLMAGESTGDVVDRVREVADLEWWQAERIVRTELAWTASATQADGIAASAQALPDLRMRWSELCDDETGEPLDDRVAVDSIAMHGQCALPGQVFRMPATAPFPDADGNTKVPAALVGKSWLFPPNRPNDRSSIQPWRPGWGIPGWRYAGGRRVRL